MRTKRVFDGNILSMTLQKSGTKLTVTDLKNLDSFEEEHQNNLLCWRATEGQFASFCY